jgi:hypothetical protein
VTVGNDVPENRELIVTFPIGCSVQPSWQFTIGQVRRLRRGGEDISCAAVKPPTRHWRFYEPLATVQEALDEPLAAFLPWLLKVYRMLNEAHATER